MGIDTSPLRCCRLWYKEPVRHGFYRRGSSLPGPSRFIDLGDREVTPGAINEAQVEGIAIERCGAGFGARGCIETERWGTPLAISGLAVANLTPYALLGSRWRIIPYGQAYGALWGVIDNLKDHGNICGGLLVCQHGRHSLPHAGLCSSSDEHTAGRHHSVPLT